MSGRDPANQPGCSRKPKAAALIDLFCAEEPVRQAAIYSLAQAGAAAVMPLVAALAASGGDDASGVQKSGWNEGAVVMEDAAYALAAIGAPAIPALVELLNSTSEWVRINVAFALGEMGPRAATAMPNLVSMLNDDSHSVVRTALDAIGQIRTGANAALPEIRRLMELQDPPESWIAPQRRKWTGLGQVQTNAAMCLLRMGSEADGAEEWLPGVLDNECGYVGGFGVEFLLRRGTPQAQSAALDYLYRHRWDSSLRGGLRTF
jgi:HEAT repeat protein